jgi:signal transduction histidine kinase/ligand-binding sensor domain-containing protein
LRVRPLCSFVVWLLVAAPGSPARAAYGEEPWSVRVWQSELPGRYVNGLVQTDDGFLWVAASGHLARFDGTRFEAFPTPERARRPIRAFLPGRGGVWLAMSRGSTLFLQPGRPPTHVAGLPELAADTLVEDDDGALWIAYHEGVVSRIRGTTVTTFDRASGLAANGAPCWLARDTRGRLWYAQAGEVGVFNDGRFCALLHLPNTVTRLASARSGGVWIGSGHRLFRYDAGVALAEMGALPEANRGAEMTVLLEAGDGALWIGTRHDGLFRRSASRVESVPTSNPEIRCLLEDREGNLWAGTGGGGLNRVQRRVVEVDGVSTGSPSKLVQSVAQDVHGVRWATTRNGLLVRATSHGWETIPFSRGRPGDATCVATDARGAVWIGTRSTQLHRWSQGRLTSWGPEQGLDVHRICTLLVSRSGDVWIAGESPSPTSRLLRASVQRLRAGKLESIALPPGIRATRAIAEDATSVVWIGAAGGKLLRAEHGSLVEEQRASPGPATQIRSLHATSDGSLWIGYDEGGGLARLKDGRFVQAAHEPGLPGLSIAQIVSDATGSLWLGTDRGLFEVERRDLEERMQQRALDMRPIDIGPEQARFTVSASECGWTGAFLTREGLIWMPMGTALLTVHPDRQPDDALHPTAFVTRVTADGQLRASYAGIMPSPTEAETIVDLRRTRMLPIPAGGGRIDIEFTAPTLRASEDLRFRYRLDDVDEGWVDAGRERIARYPRLPPGRYRFRVSPCRRESACDDAGAALEISVAPHVWQTFWFRLGLLAAFSAGLVALVRSASFRRLRRSLALLERQAALDRERTRIARDIHDDVGNRLNRITLLGELALKDAQEPAPMAAHVRAISSAVRDAIAALDEVVWTVSPRHDTLPHLVSRLGQFAVEYLRTAGIQCRLELPSQPPDWPLSPEVRHNVLCAAKEALTNCVRHARARDVSLRLDVAPESFAIVIQDDGLGCDGAAVDPGADGLCNMGQRMAEIGGRMDLTSAPGAGTVIRLVVPRPGYRKP